jgi:hypothetical protein
MYDADPDRDRALIASGDELSSLLHHPSTDVLLALLDNPAVDETQLFLLLNRKDLPAEILEEVARRKPLLKNYRVKRALAVHPRTPRLASLRLVRDLYPMDLVQLALLPGTPAELKRIAEDRLIGRLPQLPLGQKIALARRGPGRVAGALLAEGGPQVLSVVLDNRISPKPRSSRFSRAKRSTLKSFTPSFTTANGPAPTTSVLLSFVIPLPPSLRFWPIFRNSRSPTCAN